MFLKKSKVLYISIVFIAVFTSFFIYMPKLKRKVELKKLKFEKSNWPKEFIRKVQKKEFPEWMISQIQKDLEPYKDQKINIKHFDDYLGKATYRFQIKNNQLLYQKDNTHIRIEILIQSLKNILDISKLPDMDFIVCYGDFCNIDLNQRPLVPVLTFAKDISFSNGSILIPDFEALEGNWSFREQVIKAKFKYPWNEKKNRAFWRGVTTGGTFSQENYQQISRSKLVFLSKKETNFIDAKFTGLCQGAEKISKLFQGYLAPSADVLEHLKYKYQILIDGNSCSYSRAYWQLFSDGVIFKQESSHVQWFYSTLKPYVNYIPFKADCSDLVEKIVWAKENDKKVKFISQNAQKLAKASLKKSDVYLYFYLLLLEYSKLTYE